VVRAFPPLVVAWVLSRAFVLAVTAGYFQGDCGTYFQQGASWWAGQVPYRDYVVEYPPAALSVFALVAAVGSYPAFRVVFVGLMCVLDGLVFAMVWTRAQRGGAPAGAWAYLLASALLFPVLYTRFDLLPAAATLAGCLLLEPALDPAGDPPSTRRLLAGGALLGLGVAFKLYPLLIAPLLLLQLRWGARQLRRVALVAGAAVAVMAISFLPPLLAGAGRAVLGFLRYQGERGLQIESSYAAVLMAANLLVPLGLRHEMTHHAHDLAGALPAALAPFSRVAQVVAVVAVSVLAHRRRLPLTRAFAAVIAAALATANVLSPQFLIWLLPLAAVAIGNSIRADVPAAVGLVAGAALTSLVFPVLYPKLIALQAAAVIVLLARDALLMWLSVRLAVRHPTS
jgi:hypothetical protein